jgi:tetratricopeptide (TPR) repeat protein
MLTTKLTMAAHVMGTPPTCPPSSTSAQPADARSDQFSFCVALYAALYGQRPFAGNTAAELALRVVEGDLRPPPRAARVPRRIARALTRGLQAEPARRHPSMPALLADLSREPWPRRHRWLLGGTAAASLVVGAWGVVHAQGERCGGADEQLADIWDDARRDAVAAALRSTKRPYAERTWSKVQTHLTDYTTAWSTFHVAACETHARGESSDDYFDLEMACLARRRSELGALVDRLARADGEVLDRAVSAVRSLTPVRACTDREALLARVRPPEDPAMRSEVDRLRAELDQAKAAQDAGKYVEGLTLATAVAVAADSTGHRPLIAEARLRLGELHSRAAEYPNAGAALMAALWAAEAGRHDEAAAATWTELIRLGVKQGKFTDAERSAERASAAVARLGDDILAEARLGHELGSLAFHDGKATEAVSRYERALALRERVLGPDHPDTLNTLGNLGNALLKADRIDEAVKAMERTLKAREEVLGADHPEVATTLNNLGVIYRSTKRTDDAIAACQRAIVIWRTALGPDNPTIVNADLNLANIYLDRGEPANARPLLEEAVAITGRTLAEDNPLRLTANNNLGGFYMQIGEVARAEQIFRDSLAVRERLYGPDSPKIAEALANLGALSIEREREDEARPLLERAVKIIESSSNSEHSDLINPISGLASIALEQDQLDVAARHLSHLQRILTKIGGAEHRRSSSVLLIEAQLELKRDRPDRALTVLEQSASRG